MLASRSSVEVGAHRKIVSSWCRVMICRYSSDSSGDKIGGQHTIGSRIGRRSSKFFQSHLQNGIVIAEKHQRNLRRLPNAAHQIEDSRQRRAGFQRAFGSALNSRPIGQRIAERNAQFDDVRAGFCKRQNKFQRGIQ